MCTLSERKSLKQQFNQLIDDVGRVERKLCKLEEYLQVKYMEHSTEYIKKTKKEIKEGY